MGWVGLGRDLHQPKTREGANFTEQAKQTQPNELSGNSVLGKQHGVKVATLQGMYSER